MIAELLNLMLGVMEAFELQWGRDQLIAELPHRCPHSVRQIRFNGAAIN